MEQNHNPGSSHQQHVKAGQQSHKNTGKHASKSDDNKQNVSSSPGGTHELHVKAGQQSHKNS